MTRDEWAMCVGPQVHWAEAYPCVEREARRYLADHIPHELSTAKLVDALHPWPGGARDRIFKALAALATRELADCCTRGPAKVNRFKGEVMPWVWHAPTTPNVEAVIEPTCPHCGGKL